MAKFNEIIEEDKMEYRVINNLILIKIRFDQPDNLLLDIVNTIDILTKSNIPYLELGLTLNKVYLVIYNKYRDDFIRLFGEYKEKIK